MKKSLFKIYKKFVSDLSGSNLSKYGAIQKINNRINSKLKPDFVIIEGNKMFLDDKDSLFLSVYGYHEKTETKVVKKLVNEGDITIDVGANIGYYTLLLAKIVGSSGKVIAFEAEPRNFEILKKNVEENHFENVIVEKKAVSEKSGVVKFFIGEDSSTENQLFKPDVKHSEIEVESISIDEYLQDKDIKVDFIKMDIQGSEPLVIEGMRKTIEKNKNLKLMMEWWPDAIKKYNIKPDKHLQELVSLGFNIFEIDDNKGTITKTDVNSLMKKYPNEELVDVNLLLKRDKEIVKI
ncbi:FkbM family methyltransferase [Nitrosarchaeum sp.]|uniref:FkbM family methyltransferase n=1 Tax=Nitrosarchaeum sp. TaxID=2026886 RepID=UPI00247D84CD|nr:FkbM family methyltransferase [Nitrosarchaeum sp.]MCV0411906.1 FkbM family methyltransferase [Nitrosarchaeum sp.]